jgi:Tfp pilus assembly ATPase PilU
MRTRPSIPFLLDLLRMAMRKQASAIYIVPWMPPTLRIDENSVPLSSVSFTPEQSTLLVLDMLDDVHRAALDRSREVQFSLVLDGVGRFRVHAFRRHGQPAMAIRPYAIDVPTPRTLALPTLACTAAMADRGLLVLAGRSYACGVTPRPRCWSTATASATATWPCWTTPPASGTNACAARCARA